MEHIYRRASKELFGVENPEIKFTTKRNKDFRELTLEVDGEAKLKFAAVFVNGMVCFLVTQLCRHMDSAVFKMLCA